MMNTAPRPLSKTSVSLSRHDESDTLCRVYSLPAGTTAAPLPHLLSETRYVPMVHISHAPLSRLLSQSRLHVLLLPLMTISHALQKIFLTMTTLEIPDG